MRVLLICVGSRGDTEPFCSLAERLAASGHQVEFFIQRDLESLAPKNLDKVTLHLLPFAQQDFYQFVAAPKYGSDHENPRVKFVGIIADCIAELVFPCWNQVLNVAKDCQIMVTSALARSLCFGLSEKLDIPTCLVHLQPLVPTNAYPHYSHTDDFLSALLNEKQEEKKSDNCCNKNLDMHWELEKFQYEFLEERLNAMYDSMQLEPHLTFPENQKLLSGNHPRISIFNAYSQELIPSAEKEQHLGSNIYHVGALADSYIPQDFTPPNDEDDDLVTFLQNYRPICIGYGSMPYGKVQMILEFLKESQLQAILVGKALTIPKNDDGDEDAFVKTNIRQVNSLPYAWLLPQCQMMFCHGGAGVVHATLRAGIPAVISPLMGDQFSFAKLIEAKGLGCQAGASLPNVSKQDMQTAFETATACIPKAKEFGEQIRSNEKESMSGVHRVVQILENIVS